MTTKRSERSRWVTVFILGRPGSQMGEDAQRQHDQFSAIIKAFARVGRVVRVEPVVGGSGLLLKARRA